MLETVDVVVASKNWMNYEVIIAKKLVSRWELKFPLLEPVLNRREHRLVSVTMIKNEESVIDLGLFSLHGPVYAGTWPSC